MIRTPTRAGRDRQLWTGRHFFWPNCCCKSPPSSPDGIVWFAGRLYPSFELRSRVRSTGAADSGYLDSGTLGRCIRIGPEGHLWVIIDDELRRIDPATMSDVWPTPADAYWYDGGGNRNCRFALDAAGNAYVGVGTYPADLKVRVYDADGVQQSEFTMNDLFATSIAVDLDGNVFVANAAISSLGDRALVKYASDGTEQWAIGTLDANRSYCATDASGNVLLVSARSEFLGVVYGVVRKYDPDGTQVWTNEVTTHLPYAVCVDSSGDAYVVGVKYGGGTYVRKHAGSDGAVMWTTDIASSGQEAHDIAVDAAMVYAALGLGSFATFPDTAAGLDKADGTKEWGTDIDTICMGVAVGPGLAPHFQ